MFVLSMKTTRPRLAAYGLALGLLLTVMFAAGKSSPRVQTAGADGADAARVSYLREQGYAVEPQWTEVRELVVPDSDAVPAAYRGKRVKCFTYAITNHPQGDGVVAHLFEYEGRIIGGAISGDGFSQGLKSLQ